MISTLLLSKMNIVDSTLKHDRLDNTSYSEALLADFMNQLEELREMKVESVDTENAVIVCTIEGRDSVIRVSDLDEEDASDIINELSNYEGRRAYVLKSYRNDPCNLKYVGEVLKKEE